MFSRPMTEAERVLAQGIVCAEVPSNIFCEGRGASFDGGGLLRARGPKKSQGKSLSFVTQRPDASMTPFPSPLATGHRPCLHLCPIHLHSSRGHAEGTSQCHEPGGFSGGPAPPSRLLWQPRGSAPSEPAGCPWQMASLWSFKDSCHEAADVGVMLTCRHTHAQRAPGALAGRGRAGWKWRHLL